MGFVGRPGYRVDSRLKNNHSTHPPVNEIEIVERDPQDRDQRTVATNQKKKGHHVHDSKVPGAVPQIGQHRVRIPAPIDAEGTERHVHDQIAKQEKRLRTSRDGSDIESLGQTELAVVPLSKERCIDQQLFNQSERLVRHGEVALSLVSDASDGAGIADCVIGETDA